MKSARLCCSSLSTAIVWPTVDGFESFAADAARRNEPEEESVHRRFGQLVNTRSLVNQIRLDSAGCSLIKFRCSPTSDLVVDLEGRAKDDLFLYGDVRLMPSFCLSFFVVVCGQTQGLGHCQDHRQKCGALPRLLRPDRLHVGLRGARRRQEADRDHQRDARERQVPAQPQTARQRGPLLVFYGSSLAFSFRCSSLTNMKVFYNDCIFVYGIFQISSR